MEKAKKLYDTIKFFDRLAMYSDIIFKSSLVLLVLFASIYVILSYRRSTKKSLLEKIVLTKWFEIVTIALLLIPSFSRAVYEYSLNSRSTSLVELIDLGEHDKVPIEEYDFEVTKYEASYEGRWKGYHNYRIDSQNEDGRVRWVLFKEPIPEERKGQPLTIHVIGPNQEYLEMLDEFWNSDRLETYYGRFD